MTVYKYGKICAKHPEANGARNKSNGCIVCANERAKEWRKANPNAARQARQKSDKKRKEAYPMYEVWRSMRKRCNNPNCRQYKNYGGRGISFCSEWEEFSVFAAWALSSGYAPDLQIDRKDNNGNYTPDNCRWVTPKENNRNRRSTKLDVDDVGLIKTALKLQANQRLLSVEFGVSKVLIEEISTGKRWSDVSSSVAY